jgi:hypothetical protein
MPPQPDNLETDSRFPSGEWVGFFLQPTVSPGRKRMNLCLAFQNGAFTGEGKDGVGEFVIKGRYDLKSGEVTFHKHYVRQHSVFYRGFNEGKGIWGTWEISGRSQSYAFDRGGFHIWPKGMADPTGEHLSVEEEVPVEEEEEVLVGGTD